MQTLMQTWPLTVEKILDHAADWRPDAEVFTASPHGAPQRSSYAQLAGRARRLAAGLRSRGIGRGDVVAIVGANTARQLEAWYAVASLGAVCHPLNPALGADRLGVLLESAQDRLAFVDPGQLAALEPVLKGAAALRGVVVMGGRGQVLPTALADVVSHEQLIEEAEADAPWGAGDEQLPAVLMHSVGVSGVPKGVFWSHRSCVLQGLIALGPEGLILSGDDTLLPLTPFWRAAGWGMVFTAPMAGARLALPGLKTDIPSVRILCDRESATVAVAAPADLQALLEQYRLEVRRPSALARLIAVGAPCPPALAKAWRDGFGVETRSVWSLAEASAVGAVIDPAEGQMRPPFGLDLEITDAAGRRMAHDGAVVGRLKARGPAVAAGYLAGERGADSDGFIDTGDLASIDPQGRVRIVGRLDETVALDGGAISPRRIEDVALGHPATLDAALIDPPAGLAGPLLVVRRRPGATEGKAEYLRYLGERLGPVATPKDVLFVDGLPVDPAGRIDRRALRQRLETVFPAPADAAPDAGSDAEPAQAPVLAFATASAAAGTVIYAADPEPDAHPASDADPPLDGDGLAGPTVEQASLDADVAEASLAPEADAAEPAFAELAAAPEMEPEIAAAPDTAVVEPQSGELIAGDAVDGEAEAVVAGPAQAEAPESPADEAPAEASLVEERPVAQAGSAIASDAAVAPVPIDEDDAPADMAAAPQPDAPDPAPEAAPEPFAQPPPVEEPGPFAAFEPRPPVRPRRAGRRTSPSRSRSRAPVVELLLSLGLVAAIAPLVLAAVGAVGVRTGLIDWKFGLESLINDWPYRVALLAVVTGIAAVFAALVGGFSLHWRRALVSLGLPVLVLLAFVWAQTVRASYPPVHEAATDWRDPIAFSPALLKARGADANPVEPDPIVPAVAGAYMNRRLSDVNAETCPYARTAVIGLSPEEAAPRIKRALRAEGLQLTLDDAAGGRMEAFALEPWLNLRQDVAVRIRPDIEGSRVDVRSSSRHGLSDWGANCARVSRLVRALEGGSRR